MLLKNEILLPTPCESCAKHKKPGCRECDTRLQKKENRLVNGSRGVVTGFKRVEVLHSRSNVPEHSIERFDRVQVCTWCKRTKHTFGCEARLKSIMLPAMIDAAIITGSDDARWHSMRMWP